MPSPPGYTVAESRSAGGVERVALVPAGQTVANSPESVVTETFRGGVTEGDPVTYSQWATKRWKDRCAAPKVGPVDSGTRNGYAFAMWRMDCERLKSGGSPEVTLTLAIEGNSAFYTVQKTWRSMPTDAEIESWRKSYFDHVSLCDTRADSGHPCPTGSDPTKPPVATAAR